jgi:hypothetical protein
MPKSLFVLAATAPLVLATPALAAPPDRVEPVPPTTITACGTTVTITEVVQRERSRFQETEDGFTNKITGAHKVRVSTGSQSVLLSVSGPAKITRQGSTLTIKGAGRNLVFPTTPEDRAVQLAAGLPELALLIGGYEVVFTLDPDTGQRISAEEPRRAAQVIDVCQLLQ